MHTLRFRSLKLILETDQAELARDIRFDFDKASKKLAKRAINGQEAAVQYLKTQV